MDRFSRTFIQLFEFCVVACGVLNKYREKWKNSVDYRNHGTGRLVPVGVLLEKGMRCTD